MCGIVGWINKDDDLINKGSIIEGMLDTLTNRGPDQSGYHFYHHALLAHKRLIVVDPDGGVQPMTRIIKGKEYTLIYNGELYNTEDVRKLLIGKGYKFEAYSDTEVVLIAYIEWKEDCLSYINGIFAFAVWNETDQTAFLARDHLGVKPLFYSLKHKNFLFASEIKALLKHPEIEPIVGEEGVLEIFALGPARSPGVGIFKDVHEIPPGHYLTYDGNRLKLIEYWTLTIKEHEEDLKTTLDHTRDLLVDAIERQLIADVPVCTFLSGGLDSSAISMIASDYFKKHNKGRLNTYSIDYVDNEKYFKKNVFQPNSDRVWADKMAGYIGTNHHKIILNNTDLVTSLHEAVLANDLPGMADIDSSLYLFCKEVKKDATVALSGECADEIFGGYPWYTKKEDYKIGTFPWSQSLDTRKLVIGDHFKDDRIEDYVRTRYNDSIRQVPKCAGESESEASMREMFYLNIKWFMMTLLTRKDRMSMANSLEVRVPFADYRIVEYAFNIPREMKLLNGREKGLLRESLKGILPDDIVNRKKSPYPKTHHPAYTQAVQQEMEIILNDPHAPLLQMIDKENVKKLVQNQGSTIDKPWYGQLMTGPQIMAYLIQINTWMKAYEVKLMI